MKQIRCPSVPLGNPLILLREREILFLISPNWDSMILCNATHWGAATGTEGWWSMGPCGHSHGTDTSSFRMWLSSWSSFVPLLCFTFSPVPYHKWHRVTDGHGNWGDINWNANVTERDDLPHEYYVEGAVLNNLLAITIPQYLFYVGVPIWDYIGDSVG